MERSTESAHFHASFPILEDFQSLHIFKKVGWNIQKVSKN